MRLNWSLARLHPSQPRRCSNNSPCSSTDSWPIAASAVSSSTCSCFSIAHLLTFNPHLPRLSGFGQVIAQLIQTTVVVVPDITERLPRFVGDLLHREALEIGQLQHTLLDRTESLKTPLNDFSSLVGGGNVDCFHRQGVLDGGNIRAGIKMPHLELLPPVHASVIGVAQDPHFSSAAHRVKLCHHFVDFHENVLHYVFRFADIVQYFQSDMTHESMVTIK